MSWEVQSKKDTCRLESLQDIARDYNVSSRNFVLLSAKRYCILGSIKQKWKKGIEGLSTGELQRESVMPKPQWKGSNKRKFRLPMTNDTKCLSCYLASLLAWGTSSSCAILEDIRNQSSLNHFLFYPHCSYYYTLYLVFFISKPTEMH